MNISDIARWRNCEAEALHGTRQPGRLGAARYVGILAHAYMLGEPAGPVGQRVAWDATTQDAMIAQVQARAIANAGLQCMIDAGWEILETEQSVKTEQDRGRYDIHAYSNELRATAIIDLKTGSSVGSAWLQVGGYLRTFEPQRADHFPMLLSSEASCWSVASESTRPTDRNVLDVRIRAFRIN